MGEVIILCVLSAFVGGLVGSAIQDCKCRERLKQEWQDGFKHGFNEGVNWDDVVCIGPKPNETKMTVGVNYEGEIKPNLPWDNDNA